MRLTEWPQNVSNHLELVRRHNADVRAANAELEWLEDEMRRMTMTRDNWRDWHDSLQRTADAEIAALKFRLAEECVEVERLKGVVLQANERHAEDQRQLAEARKVPPLPESVEALLFNRRRLSTGGYLSDARAEQEINDNLLAAYALGLAKAKDAEEKLAKVREVVMRWKDAPKETP